MGPKAKFTKEQIIDAAFAIARTEGLDNVTMKKIAQKLGSSVAPIYVNFKDASELTEALTERIIMVSQQLLREENTGKPFDDIGRASLRFAREYSVLFRDLVMKQNDLMRGYDEKMMPVLVGAMQNDPELAGFTAEELKRILLKVRIFQLGLSVMVANGLLPPDCGMQDLANLLASAADDIVLAARRKKGQTE